MPVPVVVVLLPGVGLLVVQQVALAVVGHLVVTGHPVVPPVVPVVLLGVGHLVALLGVPPEGLAAPGVVAVVVVVVGLVGVPLRCFLQLGQIRVS